MTVLYCILVLFVGGAVKGAIGIGLPQIGVSFIALALGLKQALAILVLPIMASNVSQSCDRKFFAPILLRFWPLLIAMFVFSILSVSLFGIIPESGLMISLGVLVIVLPTIAFFRPQFRITRQQEVWAGPFTGAMAGLIGGLSTLSGPPLMIYLSCLRLPKDEFVVAVSLMFLTAAVGLGLGLVLFGISKPMDFGISTAACVPVFLGMWIGKKARVRLSERAFSTAVLLTYVVTGLSFIAKAV
ncbi:MAG TPA: sulfite exporter TauE/SafE family protein [Pseudolabrys sp.]|nr:sulfite exporter TauE/SafE family protein [Pseudolabrys sp.]